jgi:hypothetical protein
MFLDEFLPALRHRSPSGAEALAGQLRQLRREVQRLGHHVAHEAGDHTSEWGEHALDFGREAARRGAHFAHGASRQAMRGARAVQHDPLPALAVVGTLFLLARLLDRRR